jgi:hypothetical protein
MDRIAKPVRNVFGRGRYGYAILALEPKKCLVAYLLAAFAVSSNPIRKYCGSVDELFAWVRLEGRARIFVDHA